MLNPKALISVSDKTAIVPLAQSLAALGFELLSTGGTYRHLREQGLAVTEIAEHTGFPEIMDGRVKTLHPRIHGGILGRPDSDAATLQAHDIAPISLVVVNLYPFQATVADPECTPERAMANIDIGGPTMLRAAAKNHAHVGVLVDSSDYEAVTDELERRQGRLSDATRRRLAVKAFAHTAEYEASIADYMAGLDGEAEPQSEGSDTGLPETYQPRYRRIQTMRYGENPHQRAAFYADPAVSGPCVATAQQLQGKALSYNNVADADTALECVKGFESPACVIVKHANPCGVALGTDPHQAYERAFGADPSSAFGGIIAFNRELTAQAAQAIVERQFVEVILAPGFAEEALALLGRKANVRALSYPAPANGQTGNRRNLDYKKVGGGLLVQEADEHLLSSEELQWVTQRRPTAQQEKDLLFAWHVAKFVKSNAIVYARDERSIGIGAGQMSRVYSARIATMRAEDEDLEVAGAVMASDAFFPFRDGVDTAARTGIAAVIQPGGSKRDDEVIQAADEADMAMAFTGVRHFRH